MINKSKFFSILPPPIDSNIEVVERKNDFVWFRPDNIVCVVPKEVYQHISRAESVKQLKEFKELFGEGKFGIVTVFNPKAKMTKDDREFAANELGELAKGVAIITDSKMGKIAISMFLSIKKLNYPMRAFIDHKSAVEWLLSI
jgi:hypothetical protein